MYKPLIGNTERKIKNVKGKNQIKLRKNKQKRKQNKSFKTRFINKYCIFNSNILLIKSGIWTRTIYNIIRPKLCQKSGIVIYDNSTVKEFRRILEAGKLEFMDNISIRWIPDNIDTEAEGAHNGNNYIAYTFL